MAWGFTDDNQAVHNDPVLTKKEVRSCRYLPDTTSKEVVNTATIKIIYCPDGTMKYQFMVSNPKQGVVASASSDKDIYTLFDTLDEEYRGYPYADIMMSMISDILEKLPKRKRRKSTKKVKVTIKDVVPKKKGNVRNRCKDDVILPTDYLYTKESLDKLGGVLMVNTNQVKHPILSYISAAILKLKGMGRNILYIEVGEALLDSIRDDMEENKVQPKVDEQGFVSVQYKGVSVIVSYNPKLSYGYMKMYGTLSTTPQ